MSTPRKILTANRAVGDASPADASTQENAVGKSGMEMMIERHEGEDVSEFARRIRAHAIEECAKIADIHAFSARQAVRHATGPKLRQRALAVEDAALQIVKSIRALALPQSTEPCACLRPGGDPLGNCEECTPQQDRAK